MIFRQFSVALQVTFTQLYVCNIICEKQWTCWCVFLTLIKAIIFVLAVSQLVRINKSAALAKHCFLFTSCPIVPTLVSESRKVWRCFGEDVIFYIHFSNQKWNTCATANSLREVFLRLLLMLTVNQSFGGPESVLSF